MTPDEYRAAIAALGLTQLAAARLLGVNPRTSRKWACGEAPIAEPAVRMLRLMIALRISPERALKLVGAPGAPSHQRDQA